MKYIANPVEVEAHKILGVKPNNVTGDTELFLDNREYVKATAEMTARMKPSAGDYWVIQSDGYIYLNPKDVFERKYRPASECLGVGIIAGYGAATNLAARQQMDEAKEESGQCQSGDLRDQAKTNIKPN